MASILIITVGSNNHGSSRIRVLNYFDEISAFFQICWCPLRGERDYNKAGKFSALNSIDKKYRLFVLVFNLIFKRFDVILIQKQILPFPLLKLTKRAKLIYDIDDAVYLLNELKFTQFVEKMDEVIVSTPFLQKKLAVWEIESRIIHSSVHIQELGVLRNNKLVTGSFEIVWIGSPSTAKYLQILERPLARLALEFNIVLKVLGTRNLKIDGVNVEEIPWSLRSEQLALASSNIGVMPLEDTEWETMKGGYKLILYMSHGLPVVASPVGINTLIVKEDCGFLASTEEEWYNCIKELIVAENIRRKFSVNGFQTVVDEFSYQLNAIKLLKILKK
jgi:glycosyltransferase involved in cell wall biosynthesis